MTGNPVSIDPNRRPVHKPKPFYYLDLKVSHLKRFSFLVQLSFELVVDIGSQVECVLHPTLWNKSHVWDPLGVGQVYTDQYEEDNVGHPVTTVRIHLSPYFWIKFDKVRNKLEQFRLI